MLRLKSNFTRISILSRLSSTAAPNLSSDNASNVNEPKIQQIINADIKQGNPVPVFKKALLHNKLIALKDQNGEFSYLDLVAGSKKLSSQITNLCGELKN